MSHYFSNLEIADLLHNVAAALQLESEDKNRFRIIAYNRAADAIEHSSSDVKDLWDNHQLDTIAGIGEGIASSLSELFAKGKVQHFNQILAKNPPAFYELLKIPGIGPKTADKLIADLGLSKKAGFLSKLKKAAQKGRVPDHLVPAISIYTGEKKRLLLHQAAQIAESLKNYLIKCPQVIDCEVLGSLRRQASTIGDLDFAVSTQVPAVVIDYFCTYPKKARVINAGSTKASLELRDGVQVDLITCDPESLGSLLQHFTGSKHHNIALREHALKLGYSLSEHGIKQIIVKNKSHPSPRLGEGVGVRYKEVSREKRDGVFKFSDEKSFYNFLGLDFINPELREDSGEIVSAQNHTLPNLVQLSDIKGDLHVHSSFNTETSHDLGQHPVSALIEKAKQLNYSYLGLTEHNPSPSNHSLQNIYSLLQKKRELIDSYNNSDFFIFNGLEVDIMADGKLALPEKCFTLLDYAIVSIHSSFSQSAKITTDRLIAGLSHPKAKILGHPTGRLLQEREGISVDWDRLFDFCLKHQKILEIDAWPNRLDLPDVLVRQAIKLGIKLVINSDSHSLDQMEYIRYGVSVARRGWVRQKDIINTLSTKNLKEVLITK